MAAILSQSQCVSDKGLSDIIVYEQCWYVIINKIMKKKIEW